MRLIVEQASDVSHTWKLVNFLLKNIGKNVDEMNLITCFAVFNVQNKTSYDYDSILFFFISQRVLKNWLYDISKTPDTCLDFTKISTTKFKLNIKQTIDLISHQLAGDVSLQILSFWIT